MRCSKFGLMNLVQLGGLALSLFIPIHTTPHVFVPLGLAHCAGGCMKETRHLSYSSVLLSLEIFFFLSVVDCLHAAELADIASWEGKVDTQH